MMVEIQTRDITRRGNGSRYICIPKEWNLTAKKVIIAKTNLNDNHALEYIRKLTFTDEALIIIPLGGKNEG